MADPLSVVSLVAAIFTLSGVGTYMTSRVYGITVSMKETPSDIQRLEEELEILTDLFYESRKTIETSAHASKSVIRSVDLCNRRLRDFEALVVEHVMAIRDGRQSESNIARLRWVLQAPQRSRAYNSFRDAVLMLRDLVSE